MAQVCTPTGEQCYDCADYAGAFACLDKIRISDMAVASAIELAQAIESECTSVLVAADFVPCNGEPYTQAIDVSNLITASAVTSPIGATFWTPIDFGDSYGSCWRKFNRDLTVTRTDYPDFFTVAGISGDTFTIKGLEKKYPVGAASDFVNGNEIIGSADNRFTIGVENIPAFTIDIHDPGHGHNTIIGEDREGTNGSITPSFEADSGKKGFKKYLTTEGNHTGITATARVGQNGAPVPITSMPWSVGGFWYIKLSNDCV
jgi:hypothetical protein